MIAIVVGMLFVNFLPAMADKKQDYQNTYNYKRALELFNEEKFDEAKEFLNKEVADHKDNGYALAWLASMDYRDNQYGNAMIKINEAMKYLDKKEYMYSFCLGLRSMLHSKLGDEKSALEDLNTNIKYGPKEVKRYEKRAGYYLNHDKYELAMSDFKTITRLESGNAYGYLGEGVCLRNMNKLDEAIEKIDYAIKLSPNYSSAFAQRAICRLKKGQSNNAADDIVKALSIDMDDTAYMLLHEAADSSFETMDFKLKIQQMKEPTSIAWPYCRGIIREEQRKYKEAIEMYNSCVNIQFNETAFNRIAQCKYEIGDYEGAIEAVNTVLLVDSTDVQTRLYKGKYLDEMGKPNEAIAEYTRIIEIEPDCAIAYHKRGWVKDNLRDIDGAIEDYTMAIMIDPTYVYNYLCRGNMYEMKGMKDLAKKDFEEVLKRDTIPSKYEATYYAWLYFGDKDKAVAALDSALAADSIGIYYDAACLYAQMNEIDKSLDYLQKAFESGNRRFHHIERDDDLNNIKGTERYKALIEEYKTRAIAEGYLGIKTESSEDGDSKTVIDEIPFTHEGGVTKVKCKINDLPLYFVFDTGAAEVSISSLEATFMLKNGYLSEKDITGKALYQNADGNISEGTTIILRKVNIGNLELKNVKASVTKSQKAPLLLGQSVLQRLGKIEIDNARNMLIVTQKVKK